MISNNICKTGVFNDAVFLKAHCDCGHNDCIQTLIVEADTDIDSVSIEIHSKAFANYSDTGWFAAQHQKIKWIFSIIFKGYIEVDNCFIFRNEDAVENYITALFEAKQLIKKNK